MNQITQDAQEFGVHLRSGGWRLGLLVARSVMPGAGQSHRGSRRNGRTDEKVSGEKFAELAGTSRPRALRYYDAWEKAAAAGHVPHAADLNPGVEVDLPDDEQVPWSDFYSAGRSSNIESVRRSKPAVAQAIAEDPEFAAAAARALVESQPQALAAAVTADPVAADHMEAALSQGHPRSLPRREFEPTAYDLVADLRSIHRTFDRIATAVTGGRVVITPEMTESVLAEVEWLANALDLIKSGVQSDSLDAQLARLVEEG